MREEEELSEKDNKKEKQSQPLNIKSENGLKVTYDKKHLEKFTPNLLSEVIDKKKSLKIDAIDYQIEQSNKDNHLIIPNEFPNELLNPGPIDFIRRCKTNQEALEILNYLLQRKELSQKEYNHYKNQICQKGGLKKLIEESGGFKKPGYYEKKYYRKESF